MYSISLRRTAPRGFRTPVALRTGFRTTGTATSRRRSIPSKRKPDCGAHCGRKLRHVGKLAGLLRAHLLQHVRAGQEEGDRGGCEPEDQVEQIPDYRNAYGDRTEVGEMAEKHQPAAPGGGVECATRVAAARLRRDPIKSKAADDWHDAETKPIKQVHFPVPRMVTARSRGAHSGAGHQAAARLDDDSVVAPYVR